MAAAAREHAQLRTGATDDGSDVHAWAQEQAWLLQGGAWPRLDIGHRADEIADVGHSERHPLTGAWSVILFPFLM